MDSNSRELLVTAEREMPIIFLSAHATVPTSVRAMKAGAVDFLLKPCDDEVLLEAVYRALHQARQTWTIMKNSVPCINGWRP